MARTRRLSTDQLRFATLARQFPDIRPGSDPVGRRRALLDLVTTVGPIQSQVPRSPFLTAASRLPGTSYTDVRDAFADHDLLKSSSLRGTVHTSTREQFGWLDAVARVGRRQLIRRQLKLSESEMDALLAEIERYCTGDWRERADLVAHAGRWLSAQPVEGAAAATSLGTTLSDSLIWGHSGLIRRPRDDRWEKRTDVWHRAVAGLATLQGTSTGADVSLETAVRELVLLHLGSFGPATVVDVAWWCGLPLTPVRTAVAALGDAVVSLEDEAGRPLLDLADAPRPVTQTDPDAGPGTRLLAEFDSLLLGYEAVSRARFIDRQDLPIVWSKVNGIFSPVVLHRGRLVATWKSAFARGRTVITVQPFRRGTGPDRLDETTLAGPAADVARALDLHLAGVVVTEPVG